MPDPAPPAPAPATVDVVTPPTPTTPDAPPSVPLKMVYANLSRKKGKLSLLLDVRGLHEYLDKLGIQRDRNYNKFADAPPGADSVDSRTHKISPKALLSTAYRVNPDTGATETGILEIDLMRAYSTPPTLPTMESLLESVREAHQVVINHYQPVEITMTITSRRLGSAK